MAKRKSDTVKEELRVVSNRISELKELHEKAEKEEKEKIEKTTSAIKKIADENQMFCGLIITKTDILDMLTIMLTNGGQNLKVEFKMYFNE